MCVLLGTDDFSLNLQQNYHLRISWLGLLNDIKILHSVKSHVLHEAGSWTSRAGEGIHRLEGALWAHSLRRERHLQGRRSAERPPHPPAALPAEEAPEAEQPMGGGGSSTHCTEETWC